MDCFQHFEFTSLANFESWKKKEENTTCSRFIKVSGDKKFKGFIIKRFQCQRSGNYVSKATGKRELKIKGSRKINLYCPARIIARCFDTGHVSVKYIPVHDGHTNDLVHMFLRKEQKQKNASKLSLGVPFNDVINQTRKDAEDVGLQLIAKSDLHNTHKAHGLDQLIAHHNESLNLAAWVQLMKNNVECKSTIHHIEFEGEEGEGLLNSDFMLVISHEDYLKSARMICKSKHEICIDSTHELNAYHFHLTAVMCVDDCGEGIPIAFCFSSRMDIALMIKFLEICKNAFGQPMEDVVLMTPDTDIYYEAWLSVMGKPAQWLLCSWHVDLIWRRNLVKIKEGKELKSKTYKAIRSLMEHPCKVALQKSLNNFLKKEKDKYHLKEFVQYFSDTYAARAHLWAWSHRAGLRVHHGARHLEAMHQVIKHIQSQAKKGHKVVRAIHALMRFFDDKIYDITYDKERSDKLTRHLTDIRQSHRKSINMLAACQKVDSNFLLKHLRVTYEVKVNDRLPHKENVCPLKCSHCGICVHSYSCTCLDSSLKTTICKHVHYVIKFYRKNVNNCTDEVENVKENCMEQVECMKEESMDESVEEVESAGETESIETEFMEDTDSIEEAEFIDEPYVKDESYVKDECVEGDGNSIEIIEFINPHENLLKNVQDTFDRVVNKYKQNSSCLQIVLDGLTRADACAQIIMDKETFKFN